MTREPSTEDQAAKIADLESEVARLTASVLRWRQAALETWATAIGATHMDAVQAAETARSRVDDLRERVATLRATNARLRNQVQRLRRQRYARRAVRATVGRLR